MFRKSAILELYLKSYWKTWNRIENLKSQWRSYIKSYWKGAKIGSFRRSINQNILPRPTMVADIFKTELSSEDFLATPLKLVTFSKTRLDVSKRH